MFVTSTTPMCRTYIYSSYTHIFTYVEEITFVTPPFFGNACSHCTGDWLVARKRPVHFWVSFLRLPENGERYTPTEWPDIMN